MTIHDIVAIANLSLVLDLRPKSLKDVEKKQMESNGRIEPIRYCNFLFLLTRLVQPLNIIELGTLHGTSTAHLAYGYPRAHVFTVDIQEFETDFLPGCYTPNIHRIKNDSLSGFTALFPQAEADIVFFDSEHSYAHSCAEYGIYKNLTRPGGILIFDDVDLSDEMKQFWSEIPEPKINLPSLHETGFGTCFA